MEQSTSSFTELFWAYCEKKRIEETGIIGYCSCCGATHYVGKVQQHTTDCVWYEEKA